MKKKILAILMATLTVGSLLSGCGGAQSGDATGKQESSKQESSDSEEPAEIVFAYMTQNNIPESSELERIQNLINDYTVDKIKKLRAMLDERGLKTDIQVDGGVGLGNVKELMEAGANVFVAGSAVYKNDAAANVKAFLKIFDEAGK